MRSGGLAVPAFFLLTHLRGSSKAQGHAFQPAACGSVFPVLRSPSALRKPARPLQVHRAGGCKKTARGQLSSSLSLEAKGPLSCLALTCIGAREPSFCHPRPACPAAKVVPSKSQLWGRRGVGCKVGLDLPPPPIPGKTVVCPTHPDWVKVTRSSLQRTYRADDMNPCRYPV